MIKTVYLLHITEYINFDPNKIDRILIEFKRTKSIIQIIIFFPIRKYSKLSLAKMLQEQLIKYHNKINDPNHRDCAAGA